MKGDWCPIGSLNLHTMNYEQTECIWCGPNALAWAQGKWIDTGNGMSAWSVEEVKSERSEEESRALDQG